MKEINFMNSLYKYLCELIELQQYIFFTFFFCIYFGSFGPWVIGEPITQITLSVKAKFEFLMTKCCL